MKSRPFALLAAFVLLLSATPARAQCTDWFAGLFDNGAAANGTDGPIYAATMWDPDGAGPQPAELVVVGAFSHIDGVPVNNAAYRDPVTGKWNAFTQLGVGPLYACTVYNGQLIVGGQNVYRWNGTAFVYLGGGIYDGTVNAFTIYNGDLIMGGSFRIFPSGGGAILYLAQWDGSSWSAIGGGLNNWVYALTVWNGDLYVGGVFTTVGSPTPITANGVAYWNGAWNGTGLGCQHGIVQAFQPYNGYLFVGGSFTTAGSVSSGGLATWDGVNWNWVGGTFNGTVYTLNYYAGELVVGGVFTGVGGSTNLTRYNGSVYNSIGAGGTDLQVDMLFNDGTVLWSGGHFTTSDGFTTNHLAQWYGTEWVPAGGGTAMGVNAMTGYGGRLVIAGNFHQSADPDPPVSDIGEWDGSRLHPLGAGMDAQVNALKAYNIGVGISQTQELVAGGYFTHAGGVTAYDVAKWDQKAVNITPPAWQAMGAGFDGGVLALERATVNSATNTYAAGLFTHSGATTVNHVARWNATSSAWEALGGGMDGIVYALKAYGGYLYAGGSFTHAGGNLTGGLARWDGTSWSAVGGTFGGSVYALEVYNGALVMGGSFPGFGGSPNLSSWNGTSYANLGSGGADAAVTALHTAGGRLYVGGQFAFLGTLGSPHVGYWDGTWHALAGTNDGVYAIGDYGSEVEFGGVLVSGGAPVVGSPRWIRYDPSGLAWFTAQPYSQTVNPGSNVTFTATPVGGIGSVSEQWYRSGAPLTDGPTGTGSTLSGSLTASLTVSNVSNLDYGDYFAVVTDGCGPDTSATAVLMLPAATGVPTGGAPGTAFESLGPNPSRGASVIGFSLAAEAQVAVRVFDVAGRRVAERDLGRFALGRHQVTWDGRDADGRALRSGLYLVDLEVNGRSLGIRRMALVR